MQKWAHLHKLNPTHFFKFGPGIMPSQDEVNTIEESNGTKISRGGVDQAVKQGYEA